MIIRWNLLFIAPILFATSITFAGVRQERQVNSLNTNRTNMGTNAYADMDSSYTTVNPNYSNHGNVYHGENGSVAVGPRGAVAVGENGNTAAVVYDGYGAVQTGGYYYDYNSYADTHSPASPVEVGTVVESLPSSAIPVMVSGSRYYYYSEYNTFLAEVYDGYGIVYEIVPAPIGAVVSTLPSNCIAQFINGKSFTVCGGIYFQQVAGGYQVVR